MNSIRKKLKIKISSVLLLLICTICFSSCNKDDNAPTTPTRSMSVYYMYKQFGIDEKRMMKNNDTITVAIGDSFDIMIIRKNYDRLSLPNDENGIKVNKQNDSLYTFKPQKDTTTYIEPLAYNENDTIVSIMRFYVKVVPKVYNFMVVTDPEYEIDVTDDAVKQQINNEIDDYGLKKGTYVTLSYNTLWGGNLTVKPLNGSNIAGYFSHKMSSDELLLGYNNQVYSYTFSKDKIDNYPYCRQLDLDLTDTFKKKYPDKVNKVISSVEADVYSWYELIP